MTAPIPTDVMEVAATIEKDIPSRVTGANRVFIRAVIACAILAERERAAKVVRIVHAAAAQKATDAADKAWLDLIEHAAIGIETGVTI